MQGFLSALVFLSCGLLSAVPVRADICGSAGANLVNNCGFETGTFAGWILSGTNSGPGYDGIAHGVDQADAHSGIYGAYLGGFGGVLNLSQMLATTPGTTYAVTYWLAQTPATPAPYQSSFSVSFGSSILSSIDQTSDFPFTPYAFTATAVSPATNLLFGFRDDTGLFSIDDIEITPVAMPEPGTFGLLVIALGAGFRVRQGKSWRSGLFPGLENSTGT